MDAKATQDQRDLVRQIQNFGNNQEFIDAFINAINDVIKASKLCNAPPLSHSNRQDCGAAVGGPLVVLSRLELHARFVLDKVSTAANISARVQYLSDLQQSNLLSLVETSSSLEALLDLDKVDVTQDTVAVFISTLIELVNHLAQTFCFVEKPEHVGECRDLPDLIDSESEDEYECNKPGPVSESENTRTRQEDEMKTVPSEIRDSWSSHGIRGCCNRAW